MPGKSTGSACRRHFPARKATLTMLQVLARRQWQAKHRANRTSEEQVADLARRAEQGRDRLAALALNAPATAGAARARR